MAENDVIVAQKTVEAAQALVRSYDDSVKAAKAQAQAVRDLGQYLQIKAPFDGMITERNVHPGALVGPGSGTTPLLRLHQITRLRLVVGVPEALVGAIVKGARVPFTVPAYPGETFYGVVNLIAHDLDEKTRIRVNHAMQRSHLLAREPSFLEELSAVHYTPGWPLACVLIPLTGQLPSKYFPTRSWRLTHRPPDPKGSW